MRAWIPSDKSDKSDKSSHVKSSQVKLSQVKSSYVKFIPSLVKLSQVE